MPPPGAWVETIDFQRPDLKPKICSTGFRHVACTTSSASRVKCFLARVVLCVVCISVRQPSPAPADSSVICGQAAGSWHISSCMLSWIMFSQSCQGFTAYWGIYHLWAALSALLFSLQLPPNHYFTSLLTRVLSFSLCIFFIMITHGKLFSERKWIRLTQIHWLTNSELLIYLLVIVSCMWLFIIEVIRTTVVFHVTPRSLNHHPHLTWCVSLVAGHNNQPIRALWDRLRMVMSSF